MSPARWISTAGVTALGFASEHRIALSIVGAAVVLEALLQWAMWLRRRHNKETR